MKSKKETLTRTAHQCLLIRYQFKLAFFSELRQDSQTALRCSDRLSSLRLLALVADLSWSLIHSRHYKLAYQHLTESQLPETQWLQWKTVAGFINYKVRCACL